MRALPFTILPEVMLHVYRCMYMQQCHKTARVLESSEVTLLTLGRAAVSASLPNVCQEITFQSKNCLIYFVALELRAACLFTVDCSTSHR